METKKFSGGGCGTGGFVEVKIEKSKPTAKQLKLEFEVKDKKSDEVKNDA